MQTETIKLSQVKVNAENPRTISGDKFQKLVNSILVFPKMLELRPIVINMTFTALGGNMRTNALNFIAKLSLQQIAERLAPLKDYNKLSEGERKKLLDYWEKWLAKPTALVVKAEKLSPDEQQAFIVKDNVSFGAWDYDALANKFDSIDLGDWGMDVWQQPTSFDFNPTQGATPTAGVQSTFPAASEDDGIGMPQNIDEVLDNIKADSFQGLVRGESDYFSATFTFEKQHFDVMKAYIDGFGKPAICDILVKMAEEYAANKEGE